MDQRFSIRDGSIIMPLNIPRNPSTAIPNILNGKVRIQKTGYNIKAKIASGQHRMKRINQTINVNMV